MATIGKTDNKVVMSNVVTQVYDKWGKRNVW